MNNKINHKRVRRIKNVIYAVIILLFLIPAVLLIWLGAKMLSLLDPLARIVAQNQASYTQAAPPQQPEQSEGSGLYIIDPSEPEEQLPVPQGTSKPEESRPESEASENSQLPGESVPEQSGTEPTPEPTGTGGGSGQTPGGTISPPPREETSQVVTYPPYGTAESPNTGMPKKGE